MAIDTDSDQLHHLRDLVTYLADRELDVEEARRELHEAIVKAKEAGITWQEIAEATGLSKPRVYQVLARKGGNPKGSTS